MEWFIKKNATLPVIKVKLSQNGRSDYMKTMSVLKDSDVYFSMIDVETNIPKISSVLATVESGLTEDGQIEYFTYYQFKKNQTKKVGRFLAEFMIKNSDGTLFLPTTDKIYINIIESFAIDDVSFSSNYEIDFPCCSDTIGSLQTNSLSLYSSYSPGSIICEYTASTQYYANEVLTINFTNILGTIIGEPIIIASAITINQGEKIGTVIINLDDDYNNLDTTSSFSAVTVNSSRPINFKYEITSTEEFAPKPTPTPVYVEGFTGIGLEYLNDLL
jgi:hypothetical protein